MAILKMEEIREMSVEELQEKIEELKLELSKERAQVEIGGVPENAGKMNEIKKTIARIKTVLSER
jgi:large subunit ribosomal protein L29